MHRNPISPSRSRAYATLLVAAALVAGCDGPTEPPAALRLEALTATSLAGTVGEEVAPALAIRVTDATAHPVADVPVSFEVMGGGTIANVPTRTDADGSATVGRWTLGTLAGTHTVVARSADATIEFRATAAPGRIVSPGHSPAWRPSP